MKRESKLFVFDLGRVLLCIDPGKCYQSFSALGIDESYVSRLRELFVHYESGMLNEEELLDIVNSETHSSYNYDLFWQCWDQMIVAFIPEMIDQLKQLKKEFRCVLLSNTNARHQMVFERLFDRTFGYPMSDAFDVLFYSHQMSCAKPSNEIYRMVENDMQIDVSKIFFFDDLKENIDAAKKRGWNTFHVNSDVQRSIDYINDLTKFG
ncbi:HAD family phosphatase [Prolixibacteraceae bacterium]|nr:HAD family phosphatase [Prolixibacteraceae bacterium]